MEGKAQCYDLDPGLKAEDPDEVGLRVILGGKEGEVRARRAPQLPPASPQGLTLSRCHQCRVRSWEPGSPSHLTCPWRSTGPHLSRPLPPAPDSRAPHLGAMAPLGPEGPPPWPSSLGFILSKK